MAMPSGPAPADIERLANRGLPSKSSVAVHRLPGGGGFLWAVATSPDRTQDIAAQTVGCLRALEKHLVANGLDLSRIVRAEVVVTDHDNKPAFDAAWASVMPDGQGPVRSFVESRMPEGDLIEIIITAVFPA